MLGENACQWFGYGYVSHAAGRLQLTQPLAYGDPALGESQVGAPKPLCFADPQSRERERGEQRPPLARRRAFKIPQLLGREPPLPPRRLPLSRQLQSRDGKVALLRAPTPECRQRAQIAIDGGPGCPLPAARLPELGDKPLGDVRQRGIPTPRQDAKQPLPRLPVAIRGPGAERPPRLRR